MRSTAALLVFVVSVLCGAAMRGAPATDIRVARVFGPEVPGRYKHPACITSWPTATSTSSTTAAPASTPTTPPSTARGSEGRDGLDHAQADRRHARSDSEGNAVVWQAPDGTCGCSTSSATARPGPPRGSRRRSRRDGAETWSDPMLAHLRAGDDGARPADRRSSGGDYLLPVYHETGNDTESVGPDSTSLFFRYDAKTTTLDARPTASARGSATSSRRSSQVTDDYLVALLPARRRLRRPDRRLHACAPSRATAAGPGARARTPAFPNPNAAVDFLRLRNGHLLLVYNDSMSGRTPLTAAISTDGDKTYPHRRNIVEGPGDFAYPYAIQAHDGKIHLIFTSNGRTVINHAVFRGGCCRELPMIR